MPFNIHSHASSRSFEVTLQDNHNGVSDKEFMAEFWERLLQGFALFPPIKAYARQFFHRVLEIYLQQVARHTNLGCSRPLDFEQNAPTSQRYPTMQKRWHGDIDRGGKSKMEGAGYDNHILVHLHRMIDSWEAYVVAQQLVDPNAKGNINHYQLVKNILAHLLLQQQGNWDRTRELVATMWQGLNQARASLNLLDNEFKMDLSLQGTPLAGEPSQQTPLVACGDIIAPSQSIPELTDLRGNLCFSFQDERKDNTGSDDPTHFCMK